MWPRRVLPTCSSEERRRPRATSSPANGGSSGFGSGVHFFNLATRNHDSRQLHRRRCRRTSRCGNTRDGIFCCGLPRAAGGTSIGGTAEGAGNVIALTATRHHVWAISSRHRAARVDPGQLDPLQWAPRDRPSYGDGPTPNDLSPPCLFPPRTRLRHRAERPPELPSHRRDQQRRRADGRRRLDQQHTGYGAPARVLPQHLVQRAIRLRSRGSSARVRPWSASKT